MSDPASPPCYAHEFEDYILGISPARAEAQAIADKLAAVRARMASACARVGRDPDAVTLLPITKTVAVDRLRAAVAAGCKTFAENRVQEAQEKADVLSDLDLRWVIVGHLQGNKAKAVARFAHEFQALDCLELADTLQRRLDAEDRTLDVLVQINTSDEASKFGLHPDEALPLLRAMPGYSRLRVRGLMTIAMFSTDETRVRACFRRLRDLRERLRDAAIDGVSLEELSMGMSGDFESAIEEGATTIRVGQALFGPRALPDSHYWPETSG
jgi:hypothetical protein